MGRESDLGESGIERTGERWEKSVAVKKASSLEHARDLGWGWGRHTRGSQWGGLWQKRT